MELKTILAPSSHRRIYADVAAIANGELFLVVEVKAMRRLYGAVDFLRTRAELIHPTPEILGESLEQALILDPTDNLILASILNPARAHGGEAKAFLSENWKDFNAKPYPKAAIELTGIK